jgi:hypothetical protein
MKQDSGLLPKSFFADPLYGFCFFFSLVESSRLNVVAKTFLFGWN